MLGDTIDLGDPIDLGDAIDLHSSKPPTSTNDKDGQRTFTGWKTLLLKTLLNIMPPLKTLLKTLLKILLNIMTFVRTLLNTPEDMYCCSAFLVGLHVAYQMSYNKKDKKALWMASWIIFTWLILMTTHFIPYAYAHARAVDEQTFARRAAEQQQHAVGPDAEYK